MHALNADLVDAFPSTLRKHALVVAEAFPEPDHPLAHKFSVKVSGEAVTIPYRLYHSPGQIKTQHLTDLEKELVDCLLTRHHDGFVRQRYLERIIRSGNPWIPPFVIQLLGEYSIEVIGVIDANLSALDNAAYREFLQTNPGFLARTAQRVASYWDCYYRVHKKDEYAGFRVLNFFRSMAPRWMLQFKSALCSASNGQRLFCRRQ
jgi:hypothetical protein